MIIIANASHAININERRGGVCLSHLLILKAQVGMVLQMIFAKLLSHQAETNLDFCLRKLLDVLCHQVNI